jgi:chromosomal replication initiator protein
MSLEKIQISPYVYPGLKLNVEDKRIVNESVKHLKYKITKDEILNIVADECGVKPSQILGRIREREIVNGRFMYCAILYRSFGYTLKGIGKIIGGRDHTTISHSIEAFKDRYRNEEDFKSRVDEIYNKLGI